MRDARVDIFPVHRAAERERDRDARDRGLFVTAK